MILTGVRLYHRRSTGDPSVFGPRNGARAWEKLVATVSEGPGWWWASDGKRYPPELHLEGRATPSSAVTGNLGWVASTT
jgi:hypothetical protein